MEHVSEENRIKSAENKKLLKTEYLKEPDLDQHLQLSSRIDRCSERVEDWVGHALEKSKRTEVVPSFLRFVIGRKTENGTHQYRNEGFPLGHSHRIKLLVVSSKLTFISQPFR